MVARTFVLGARPNRPGWRGNFGGQRIFVLQKSCQPPSESVKVGELCRMGGTSEEPICNLPRQEQRHRRYSITAVMNSRTSTNRMQPLSLAGHPLLRCHPTISWKVNQNQYSFHYCGICTFVVRIAESISLSLSQCSLSPSLPLSFPLYLSFSLKPRLQFRSCRVTQARDDGRNKKLKIRQLLSEESTTSAYNDSAPPICFRRWRCPHRASLIREVVCFRAREARNLTLHIYRYGQYPFALLSARFSI